MQDNSTIIVDFRDEVLAVWEIGLLIVIFFITITGNCLIFLALYLRRCRCHQRKLTRMYFFMMHLSIADFITGIFNVLPQLAWKITFRFQGGPVLCKVIKFFQPLGNYLSSYVLTVTAIDRYHAICHPFSYCRTSSLNSRLMVYAAWSFALLLCIPQTIVFSYQEITEGIWDCWASFVFPYGERAYVTWYSISVFLLPFIVLLFTYTSILAGIKKNTEMPVFNYQDNRKAINVSKRPPLISRARIKTVKQMVIVVSLYVITSCPFIGCELWAIWDPSAVNSTFFAGRIYTILSLLSSITSCVNPWIYLGFNRELRLILLKFLKRTILRRNNLKNYDYELSYINSHAPSTKSSLIGSMFRCASMYRTQSQDHSTDFSTTRRLS